MYKPKICPLCGDSFQPLTAKQKYCKKVIKMYCIVCGSEYEGSCHPDSPTTCANTACKKQAGSIASTKVTKICRTCGQPFHPASSRQLDCGRSITKICATCGKEFIATCSQNVSANTCSKECLVKYTTVKQAEGWANKQRECILCGKIFTPVNNTQKICTDMQYRDCVVCGKRFQLDTLGISKEWAVTCSKKCQVQRAHDSITPEKIKAMTQQRRLARFGDDIELLNRCNEFSDNPKDFISKLDHKPSLYELAQLTGLSETTVGQIVLNNDVRDLVKYKVSKMEQEVIDTIKNIDSNIKVVHNTDRIITPYQIDVWLPDCSFGIECNPTSSHNSSRPLISGDPLSNQYHRNKTNKAEENGIFLFHIFGYEWTHKRPIIESMIRNILGKNENVIYARKCVIKEVPAIEAYKFLEDNHRQGGAQSPIRLGLYYNDNLVSLMTFGKMRNSIGTGRENLEKAYELVRFCNILNTSVVGGASRLFKHFIREHQPEAIRSFSDRAHTRGDLYKTLGFTEVRRSDAGYVWVNVVTDVAYHRVNAQKQNIKKFLNDDSIDLTQSEKTIMETHGFVRVFDSGTITWEWRAENN